MMNPMYERLLENILNSGLEKIDDYDAYTTVTIPNCRIKVEETMTGFEYYSIENPGDYTNCVDIDGTRLSVRTVPKIKQSIVIEDIDRYYYRTSTDPLEKIPTGKTEYEIFLMIRPKGKSDDAKFDS